MTLHIIHLPTRTDRWDLLQTELSGQGITDYKIWNGIIDPGSNTRGISRAHKQIIKQAKENHLPEVLIAEDDLHFTAPGAFKFFLENKPADFDIYLASIYFGNIKPDNTVDDFAGLTFYIVHERFYDTFLSRPENLHLDRALKNSGKILVCNPFPVIQHKGYSDNVKRYCDYEENLKSRKLFTGG